MQILGRETLRNLVKSEPNQHCAVIIAEYNGYEAVRDIVENCKKSIVLEMDDVISDRLGSPAKEHVEKILNIDPDFNIVACKQGISRSSAIAYLIECQRTSPEEAIKILNEKIHYPNEKILKFGLELIGEQIKIPVSNFYKKLAEFKKWSWFPHNMVTKYFKD